LKKIDGISIFMKEVIKVFVKKEEGEKKE